MIIKTTIIIIISRSTTSSSTDDNFGRWAELGCGCVPLRPGWVPLRPGATPHATVNSLAARMPDSQLEPKLDRKQPKLGPTFILAHFGAHFWATLSSTVKQPGKGANQRPKTTKTSDVRYPGTSKNLKSCRTVGKNKKQCFPNMAASRLGNETSTLNWTHNYVSACNQK